MKTFGAIRLTDKKSIKRLTEILTREPRIDKKCQASVDRGRALAKKFGLIR